MINHSIEVTLLRDVYVDVENMIAIKVNEKFNAFERLLELSIEI